MKIAININELTLSQNTGVKVYTREIVRALGKIDKKNEYILYLNCRDEALPRLYDDFNNFIIKSSKSRLPFWTYAKLPREIKKDRLNILFMPIQAVPFFKKPKNLKIVVTVHDLAFLIFPDHFTRKDKFLLNFHTKRAIKMADKIIAPSEATKKDIIKFYGVNRDKIEVIWHGVNKNKTELSSVLSLSKTNSSYLLFVGSIQPRKNIAGLIEAFELVKKSRDEALPRLYLVVCGGRGWMADKIYKRAKESEFSSDIVFTGSVSNKERDELYKNALIFVFPSLYEGFGLPVLEAMNYGVPCVVGNNSSLSEIAGENALLVNANDSVDIAEKINLLISDSELRKDLSQRGIENAKRFSWNKAAEKMLEVFEEVVK